LGWDFADLSFLDILRYPSIFFDISDKFWAQFGHSSSVFWTVSGHFNSSGRALMMDDVSAARTGYSSQAFFSGRSGFIGDIGVGMTASH
jgi:hypothetical protein